MKFVLELTLQRVQIAAMLFVDDTDMIIEGEDAERKCNR